MSEDEKLINEIGKLPGSNVYRSIVFIIYVALMIVALKESPQNISSFFNNLSTILLVAVILIIPFGFISANFVENSCIKDIIHPASFFRPKILINISISIFFFVICLWVVVLGGILRSPFSDLLTVSPIYLVWQILRRDELDEYERIFAKWISIKDNKLKRDTPKEEIAKNRYIKLIKTLEWSPIFLIIITVILGEIIIRKYNIHLMFNTNINMIFNSSWHLIVSYLVFFIAVISTIVGVFPKELKQKIIQKSFL